MKERPNRSLEPTRVGKPPLAAQLQRYDLGVKSNVNREFNSQANL